MTGGPFSRGVSSPNEVTSIEFVCDWNHNSVFLYVKGCNKTVFV